MSWLDFIEWPSSIKRYFKGGEPDISCVILDRVALLPGQAVVVIRLRGSLPSVALRFWCLDSSKVYIAEDICLAQEVSVSLAEGRISIKDMVGRPVAEVTGRVISAEVLEGAVVVVSAAKDIAPD